MVKSSSRRTLVITILALFALLVLANYTENIVSFAIYNQDSGLYKLNETISLTINQEIPSTSHLTININSQDYIKNLTELTNNFNLTELTINLESFNILSKLLHRIHESILWFNIFYIKNSKDYSWFKHYKKLYKCFFSKFNINHN